MGMAQALATANDAGTRATRWPTAPRGSTPTQPRHREEPQDRERGRSDVFNQYSVIEVSGARNWEGAQDFSNWIRSPKAQALIKTYGEYTYPGQVMFEPNAGPYPW